MRIQRDLEEKTIALDQTAYIDRLLSTYKISGYETIPCRASIYELQDKPNEPYEQKLFQSKIGIASIKRSDVPPKLKHIRVKYHSVKACVKSDIDIKYIPTNLKLQGSQQP